MLFHFLKLGELSTMYFAKYKHYALSFYCICNYIHKFESFNWSLCAFLCWLWGAFLLSRPFSGSWDAGFVWVKQLAPEKCTPLWRSTLATDNQQAKGSTSGNMVFDQKYYILLESVLICVVKKHCHIKIFWNSSAC